MTTNVPVLLILGAGPNVGEHVARAFAAKGYKVALTSRKVKEDESSTERLHLPCDLSDPDSVAGVFAKVKKSLGYPSVVVYNAAGAVGTDAKSPLSITLSDFSRNLNVNTVSVFAAAQQAVSAFAQLPSSAPKTFIYTGNALNTMTMASLVDLGVGKSATAHLIETIAGAYAEQGFKFYYADERTAEGSPVYQAIDGEAHGAFYVQLAESDSQGPWQATFVKGVGYQHFATASP